LHDAAVGTLDGVRGIDLSISVDQTAGPESDNRERSSTMSDDPHQQAQDPDEAGIAEDLDVSDAAEAEGVKGGGTQHAEVVTEIVGRPVSGAGE
jgi:hypothetical protein